MSYSKKTYPDMSQGQIDDALRDAAVSLTDNPLLAKVAEVVLEEPIPAYTNFPVPKGGFPDQVERARHPASDFREEERIPASDPIKQPAPEKAVARKRPITVTVSGPRGSGKTTLIAIVAQALRNSAHAVEVPKHTPNATMAVADLHEQFDVTFVESEHGIAVVGAGEDLGVLVSQTKQLEAAHAKIAELEYALTIKQAHIDEYKDVNQHHYDLWKASEARLAALPTIDQINEAMAEAFELIRGAGAVEQQRAQVKMQVDNLRRESNMLQDEVGKRTTAARHRIADLLSGLHHNIEELADEVVPEARNATDRLLEANIAAALSEAG